MQSTCASLERARRSLRRLMNSMSSARRAAGSPSATPPEPSAELAATEASADPSATELSAVRRGGFERCDPHHRQPIFGANQLATPDIDPVSTFKEQHRHTRVGTVGEGRHEVARV